MPLPDKIRLQANAENLPQFLAIVTRSATEAGIEADRITEINIAVEEALVNTIKHGYEAVNGEISLFCLFDDTKRFIIRIEDDTSPFDPTSYENSERSGPLKEREVGGLGILLIKQLMADVSYERIGNKNVLTLYP